MTEKQIMTKFCEDKLGIDIETLNVSQLMEMKNSLSYAMYALQTTLIETGKAIARAFK